MPALASLYEPIAADLQKVCRIFDDELFSDLPIINDLCTHIRGYRGKMLRPALLLLSGRACGRVTPEHLTLAAVVEMVHMATLVHDDVLDDADLRRRCATVNHLQGNEAAVLLGDYLISHAFHLCSSLESQEASRTIGATTNMVCEGELQQVHHRGDLHLTTDQYLQIISRKTAALTGACCLLGARFAGADRSTIDRFEQYGLQTGVAFQITDDVLDLVGSETSMGKTLGRDLEKRKLTLPLIHCLANETPARRQALRTLLADGGGRGDVLPFLQETGSLEFALAQARQCIDAATGCLDGVPASDARGMLIRMARSIAEREQ